MNPRLRQIADLIKSRRFDQARQQLEPYLKEHPQDTWAWHLNSFVEPGHTQRIAAAKRAAALAPDNEQMQARLAKLLAAQPRQPRRRWGLLAAVFGVAVLSVIGLLMLRSSSQSPDAPLPTLAALVAPTTGAIPTETTVAISSMTEVQSTEATSVDTPATIEITAITEGQSTQATATVPVEATVVVQQAAPSSLPPSALPPLVPDTATSQSFPTPEDTAAASTDLPSASGTPTFPLRPTRVGSTPVTPIGFPTPIPITATPAFGSITEPGVPVNMALNIGTGEMRVVDVSRPAEGRITDLGGSVPNAPADQTWVLVEALIICTDERNCVPNPSSLWIIGSSGAAYRPSPQLNLTPIFGSVLSNRQVWGYLGFVVPTSENSLRLVLFQAGQPYVFALQ